MGSIVKKWDLVKPKMLLTLKWTEKYFHHLSLSNELKYKNVETPQRCYMFNQMRGKKNRKKRERANLNDEQKKTKLKVPPVRLEDRTTVCEPPNVISKNIKKEIMKVCVGKERTRRHFKFRNKYQLSKLLGLTHDQENIKEKKKNPSTFVTPLTKLQHEASLPRTMHHDRFSFPHSFQYSVIWHGSSIVDHEENNICFFSSYIRDLSLSARERKKVTDILGEERVDPKNEMIFLESNFFNTYNHNAAYLGDVVQFLMRRVRSL
ncbi:Uncharacterized protein PCOAH_00038470 [Plasmodium coatneyi]|uniref:Uncharacterized protein n=1 Tax=Plasmodium coatneyi TaxID=208452 RepID=A0A1B1E4Y6_9APIC|nr:Uncharacterized protein PCOAH_00038470 [Plasmodium coatneyi]ANQ10000.1 Uncharacterized protein PCOAH_00038470 [Plasmodium coatneyi]